MANDDTTLPRRQPPPPPPRELALRVLWSPSVAERGRLRRLSLAGLELGRGEADDAGRFALADPRASRVHAAVAWDAGRERFVLSDCGSRNGTRHNGRDIERELLSPGDRLRLGDTVLHVLEVEPDLEPSWRAPPECLLAGASAALQRLLRELARFAKTDLTALVEGETGTGKDVMARELHRVSARAGAYVALNCAAIVDALFESELFGHARGAFSGASEARDGALVRAHGGTLFLDEVAELSPAGQAKLLRVLEDRLVRPVGADTAREVDVRFVCATNRELRGEVAAGRFRADLYARLGQFRLRLPPLRERPDDLGPIIERLLAEEGRGFRLGADAFEALALHAFPFNVRELVALLRKVMLGMPAGGLIELADIRDALALPAPPRGSAAPRLPPPDTAEPTQAELALVLSHFGGKVSEAARYFARGRTQLYRWLRKHALDPAAFRRAAKRPR